MQKINKAERVRLGMGEVKKCKFQLTQTLNWRAKYQQKYQC